MFEELQIKNYRSCQDTSFSLHPQLSVLIGPNGAGKTNILNAILLLRKLCFQRERYQQEEASNQCVLKAKFELSEKIATLTAKIGTYTDDKNSDLVITSEQSWYMPDFTGSRKRIKTPLALLRHSPLRGLPYEMYDLPARQRNMLLSHYFEMEKESYKPLRKVQSFLNNIKYYSASQFTNPSLCPVSIEIETKGGRQSGLQRRRGHSKFLYDLYGEYEKEDNSAFQEFVDIIGPSGIGLIDELEFKEILTSSIDYTVRSGGKVKQEPVEKILVVPQFKIGQNKLSPNQLSEGTFKTITLLFYLVTENSSLLLIEEPEVCVHHGLLRSIVELIRDYSSEKQIILSTHSDFIIDAVQPENVFMVKRHVEKGTLVKSVRKSMPAKEFKALKSYLDNDGNLGEYWRHGGMD